VARRLKDYRIRPKKEQLKKNSGNFNTEKEEQSNEGKLGGEKGEATHQEDILSLLMSGKGDLGG